MKPLIMGIFLAMLSHTAMAQWTKPQNFPKESVYQWYDAITSGTMKADTIAVMLAIKGPSQAITGYINDEPVYKMKYGYVLVWHGNILYYLDDKRRPIVNKTEKDSISGILCVKCRIRD